MEDDSIDLFDREQLREVMVENATEINRIMSRINEAVKRRGESEMLQQEWREATADLHARYDELCFPGGPYPELYKQIRAGDSAMIEVALCFLEVRPYFFRSGYHWKTILQKCKRAPMSAEQAGRFATILQKYIEWKRLKDVSAKRGAAVRRDLLPLLLRFYRLFPVELSDTKFDGLVTVGDLYRLLCAGLKVEPHNEPETTNGAVRQPCTARVQEDMSIWARDYRAWREAIWTPEDVWATLVTLIAEVYCLDPSFAVSTKTILREPSEF